MIDFPVNNPLEETPLASQVDSIARYRTVVDANGNNVIDDNGLVSENNFTFGQAGSIDESSTSTTSTSVVDVPNCTISQFTISRTRAILVLFSAQLLVSGSNEAGNIRIAFNGNVDEVRGTVPYVQGTKVITITIHVLRTLAAGTWTIKGMWNSSSSGSTVTAYNRQITFMLLGS